MIRIGVIGTGFGSLVHVPAFREIEGVEIIGIASRDLSHALSSAEKFGVRAFSTWHELIECHDIDAVSVALPAHLHPEVVLAAIAKGKSVLCEKPLALNVAGAERMLEASRKSDIIAMVDFEFPEFPAWQKAKHILDSGELGTMQSVSIEWTTSTWADPKRPWSWKCDRTQGGGVMTALGIHVLHYVEWFLCPIQSLIADISTAIHARHDETNLLRAVSAEDTAHLILRLESGLNVHICLSNVSPNGKGHVLTFQGEDATLILKNDNRPGACERYGITEIRGKEHHEIMLPCNPVQRYTDGRVPAFLSLASRFISAIKEHNTQVRPSFADGFRAQILLDAVYASAEKKTWIDMPTTPR